MGNGRLFVINTCCLRTSRYTVTVTLGYLHVVFQLDMLKNVTLFSIVSLILHFIDGGMGNLNLIN